MSNSFVNVFLVTMLSIIVCQSGCSNSAKTNTNIAKNSNEKNTNAGANSTSTSTNTTRIPGEPAIVISAANIVKEFDKDHFAAHKKFGNKKIEVSGVVETVELRQDSGFSSVYLRGYKNRRVRCYASQFETEKIEQLERGASVTLLGNESQTSMTKQGAELMAKEAKSRGIPGVFGGWDVEIADCVFK